MNKGELTRLLKPSTEEGSGHKRGNGKREEWRKSRI